MAAFKQTALALALVLAGTATAQAPAPRPSQRAPQPGQQAGQTTLTQEQQSALGAVWSYTQIEAGLGDVAASRGSSPDVKDFAAWVGNEHKRLGPQLAARLQERRFTTPSSLPPPADKQQLEQEVKQLSARSGDDFDGALLAFMKQHGETFVNALKRARDVTEGHDPAFKKVLDEAEDAEEGYLARARQLDAQRAGAAGR
jgi:predicted outer membrane protein